MHGFCRGLGEACYGMCFVHVVLIPYQWGNERVLNPLERTEPR